MQKIVHEDEIINNIQKSRLYTEIISYFLKLHTVFTEKRRHQHRKMHFLRRFLYMQFDYLCHRSIDEYYISNFYGILWKCYMIKNIDEILEYT